MTPTCSMTDAPTGVPDADPTTVMSDPPPDHHPLAAFVDPSPTGASSALRELADAAVAAALARPFTPWSRGRADDDRDVDPGVEFGRILSWLDRQPGPAGHDAAAHLVRTYVQRYHERHPELDADTILRGIDRSVRERAPDLGRITELHRHAAD